MEADRYDLVLVAVVKSRQDLERAAQEGWYRIPMAHLPSRAGAARFIAFYLPAGAFGQEGGAVRYLAAIRSWEVCHRRDLIPEEPEHPHADALYYRLNLGPLERLAPPIRCGRWKRVAFILTHWERLHQAEELRDLLHGSIWQERLWSALRQAGILE